MRPNFAATLADLLVQFQQGKNRTAAPGDILAEKPNAAADQGSVKPTRPFDSKTPGRVESSGGIKNGR